MRSDRGRRTRNKDETECNKEASPPREQEKSSSDKKDCVNENIWKDELAEITATRTTLVKLSKNSSKMTKFLLQCYINENLNYDIRNCSHKIMIEAINTETSEDIKKVYSYKELHERYSKSNSGLEVDETKDLSKFLKRILKKIEIQTIPGSERVKMSFKASKKYSKYPRMENSMSYEVDSIKVIQETIMTSQKQESPKGRNVINTVDFSIPRDQSLRHSMAYQSNLERTLKIMDLKNRTLVNATISDLAFNKRKQKKVKREIKMRKTLQLNPKKLIPATPIKEVDDLVTIEESKNNEKIDQNSDSFKDFNEREVSPPPGVQVSPPSLNSQKITLQKHTPTGRNKPHFASPIMPEVGVSSSTFSREVEHSSSKKLIKMETPEKSQFKTKPKIEFPINLDKLRLGAIITTQKLIRGFLARRRYQWHKAHSDLHGEKVYSQIFKKDTQYYLIQGFLLSQTLKVEITDLETKEIFQQLEVDKKEYLAAIGEISGQNEEENSFGGIDYQGLLEGYLEYDEVDRKFRLNKEIKEMEGLVSPGVSRVSTLQAPDINRNLLGNFATSRGSILTSSMNLASELKLPSELNGPTTFGRSSDTSLVNENQ